MKFTLDYRIYRALAFGWMVIIFWLSSRSELPAPSFFQYPYIDKLIHAIIFGILGFFYARSFRPRQEDANFTRVLLVTLMVAGYGGFDEIHQLFVPGREASLGDLAADTAGGFLAAVIFWKK